MSLKLYPKHQYYPEDKKEQPLCPYCGEPLEYCGKNHEYYVNTNEYAEDYSDCIYEERKAKIYECHNCGITYCHERDINWEIPESKKETTAKQDSYMGHLVSVYNRNVEYSEQIRIPYIISQKLCQQFIDEIQPAIKLFIQREKDGAVLIEKIYKLGYTTGGGHKSIESDFRRIEPIKKSGDVYNINYVFRVNWVNRTVEILFSTNTTTTGKLELTEDFIEQVNIINKDAEEIRKLISEPQEQES